MKKVEFRKMHHIYRFLVVGVLAILLSSCKTEQVGRPETEGGEELGPNELCEAVCGNELNYNFTKELENFTAEIKVRTQVEQGVYSAVVNNGMVTSRSLLRDAGVTTLTNQIKVGYGWGDVADFEVTINGERLNPEQQSSMPTSVCGTSCVLESYELNTDNLEAVDLSCNEECSGTLLYQFTSPLSEYDYQVVTGYYPSEEEIFAGRYESSGEQETIELPQNEYGITSIDYSDSSIQINYTGSLDLQTLNIKLNRIGKGQGVITDSSATFVCNNICISATRSLSTDEFLP